MSPANVSLDPMANLWPSGGSPTSNGYFTNNPSSSMSPPDLPNSARGAGKNENSFGTNDASYLNGATSQAGSTDNSVANPSSAGDTFMGASTPGWKWPGMETNNR